MSWLAILMAIAVAVALWMWWHTGSVANSLDSPGSVMRMLQYLMHRGPHRAELQFRVRSDRCQQMLFTKYVRNDSEVGVCGSVHESLNPKEAFERLQAELATRNIRYTIELDPKKQRRLVMDVGRDLGLAAVVVSLLFESILRVRLETDCVAYFKYVLTKNVPRMTGFDVPDV